jgi:predicted metal-binding protein
MTPEAPVKTQVTVCNTCPAGKAGLAAVLTEAIAEHSLFAEVAGIDCMSGCTRPSAVAFRAPGKTAYLFGEITGADLPHILAFLRHYGHSPDGNFADARVLGSLRLKAIARIPG